MKIHVVVNSRSEVIATVAITPITMRNNEGIVGVDPLPDQTVYELEIPETEVTQNLSELYQKCDQAIKSGAARRVEPLFQ